MKHPISNSGETSNCSILFFVHFTNKAELSWNSGIEFTGFLTKRTGLVGVLFIRYEGDTHSGPLLRLQRQSLSHSGPEITLWAPRTPHVLMWSFVEIRLTIFLNKGRLVRTDPEADREALGFTSLEPPWRGVPYVAPWQQFSKSKSIPCWRIPKRDQAWVLPRIHSVWFAWVTTWSSLARCFVNLSTNRWPDKLPPPHLKSHGTVCACVHLQHKYICRFLTE